MRTSTAYFAGVATVVAAVAAGLGGGYLAANIVSPHEPRHGTEMTRLERRMSSQPIPVTTAPSEPVPYVAATTPAATAPIAAPAAPPAEAAASSVAAPAEQQSADDSPAVKQAFARARDADIKRAAAEKRRAERRQRSEDRRRLRQPREHELEAVAEKVREVTGSRQAFIVGRERREPRIGLFDLD